MFISEETLDDLMREVFQALLTQGRRVYASKGWNTELSGVLLEIKNPRGRLSRTESKGTVFSCLGETLWYLAETNRLKFIEHYISLYKKLSDDGQTIYGGYGPRLFKKRDTINQVKNVSRLLKKRRSSRQAVIQLFDAEDIVKPHKDIPCTCTLQFLIRRNCLHMLTHMRSNDAYLGLPHDVFAFTFLQEILARSLGVRLGTYKHMVGSLHIYDADRKKVKRFLTEGWQSQILMPAMPVGNPWPNIKKLLAAEARVRRGAEVNRSTLRLPGYWNDLVILLQIFAKSRKDTGVAILKRQMNSKVYDLYIDKRIAQLSSRN